MLQNVQVRVDLAYQAFFHRVKSGEKEVDFPHFKGKGRYDSIMDPQYGKDTGTYFKGDRLILSKVGAAEVVLHRLVEGTIKTVTLSHARSSKWFVLF